MKERDDETGKKGGEEEIIHFTDEQKQPNRALPTNRKRTASPLERIIEEGKRIPANCGSKGRILSQSGRIALFTLE